MDRLIFGKPFTLVVTRNIVASGYDEHMNTKLRAFLVNESFTYETKIGTEHHYFLIDCDNLTDATKIETYLQTEK